MTATRSKPNSLLLTLLVLAVAIVAITLLLATRAEPPTLQATEKTWSVQAHELVLQSVSPELKLLGSVESPLYSDLTAVVTADVSTTPAQEGDRVNAGQLLVQLDSTEAQLVLQQRQADVLELEAQVASELKRHQGDVASLQNEETMLALAEKAVARQKRLATSNLASEANIDEAEQTLAQQQLLVKARKLNIEDHANRLKQIRARLKRAEALAAQALLDVERTAIHAPFDGQITRMDVAPGERVRTGDRLLTVFAHDAIEIRAQVPNRWVGILREALARGDTLTATADNYGRPIQLRLDRVAGEANPNAGGLDALFQVVAGQQQLVLGHTLNITLALPAIDDVYTVPISAIYGTDRVYAVTDERLQGLTVQRLGDVFTDQGAHHVILRGQQLKPGMRLITTQLPSAISGLKVAIRGDDA